MRKTIAVDFDGCLCKENWPEIGAPNLDVINAVIKEQQHGSAIILWTCREGEKLDEAVRFCKSYGLEFDAVNENLPERIKLYGNDCRKIGADEYWDDRAVHMPAIRIQMENAIKTDEVKSAPLTNADRIRAMSDEELARLLYTVDWCEICEYKTEDGFCLVMGKDEYCEASALNWLQQPAEEE